MKVLLSELEDEVKDGFYIDSLMKCCWAAQMEILEEIDSICQKHHIQYFAEFGTMLGAVRHQGMIPWDDDLDICMKREDYNKFLKVAKKELSKGCQIMDYRNKSNYWDVMARIINYNSLNINDDFLEKYHYFPFVAGVDIFPMDYVPVNKSEGELLKRIVNDVKGIADSYGEGLLTEKEFQEALDYLETLCNMKIEREGDVRTRLYDIVVSLYSIYKEEESEEIALMPLWLETGRHSYDKRYFSNAVRLPFGKTTLPVSVAYDAMLRKKYGDYMKMVKTGGGHDYPYYQKQIRAVEKKGYSFSKFQYTDRIVRERKGDNSLKVGLNADDLVVLENAHKGLFKLLVIQDKETAIQLLLKCQEGAISLGNNAENSIKNCEKLVQTLEEYCELIFQIYQVLQQGEMLDAEGVYQLLQEQLQAVKEEYSKEYERKQKIVFVVDQASKWKSLESVWKAAKEDKEAQVTVLVVPYYYKKIGGDVLEEHYEREAFPEYVEAVDYREFSLENHHPDVIYINSPYDKYNYIYSRHPYFYSSRLVNFTEKLVYLPWFTMDVPTREDERGWQSMQHFVTMPGVVNADQVIVQSEEMKEAYVEYLTDWAGEETRELWEEKIRGLGSPLEDTENEQEEAINNLSEEWKQVIYKEDSSRKKILLYSISGTGFVERGTRAVEKLQSVLELVKENKEDIVFMWCPNRHIEVALKNPHPDLWKAYEEIVENFKKEAWGIYADGLDAETAVLIGDAYYGDTCALSQAVVVAGKPVMIQNFEC